jgi:hypothetical protein
LLTSGLEESLDVFGRFAKPTQIVSDEVVTATSVAFYDHHAFVIGALPDALC